MSVGGINVTDQYFSPVYNISTQLGDEALDGILGLGLPAASSLQQVRTLSSPHRGYVMTQ